MDDNDSSNLPPVAERRHTARKKVLLGGVATYDRGFHTVDCQIRDLNEKGARVAISGTLDLPENLYLIITKKHLAHEARVVWRSRHEIGLSFTASHDLRKATNPDLAYLHQILAARDTVCITWR